MVFVVMIAMLVFINGCGDYGTGEEVDGEGFVCLLWLQLLDAVLVVVLMLAVVVALSVSMVKRSVTGTPYNSPQLYTVVSYRRKQQPPPFIERWSTVYSEYRNPLFRFLRLPDDCISSAWSINIKLLANLPIVTTWHKTCKFSTFYW